MSIFANVFLGNTANDGTGDALRTAFQKIDQNFANIILAGNVAGVQSIVSNGAQRTGNVQLYVNDVIGAVSLGTLNSAMVASNVYATSVINTFTADAANVIYNEIAANLSTTIANTASTIANAALAPLSGFEANLTAANVHIQIIDANLGTLTSTVGSVLTTAHALDANVGTITTTLTSLYANAAVQEGEISSINSGIVGIESYLDSLDANVGVISVNVNDLLANAATQESELAYIGTLANSNSSSLVTLTANAATQETEILGLRANITAANLAVANAGYATISQLGANVSSLTSAILSTNANVTAANAHIQTVDANLGSVTTSITILQSNAATQSTAIATLDANIGTVTTTLGTELTRLYTLDANLGVATTNINVLISNAGIQSSAINSLNANVVAANIEIQSIESNIGLIYNAFTTVNNEINAVNANVTAANIALAATVVALTANATIQELEIGAINANVNAANINIAAVNSSLNTFANTVNGSVVALISNAATQQTTINAIYTQGNVNTSSINTINTNFNTLTASVNPGNITVTGNVTAGNIVAGAFYFSNGAPFVSGGTGSTGNITFSNYTISTVGDTGGAFGITLNPANGGEIHLDSYTGVDNTNPGYWLHVGDGSLSAAKNVGNVAIDFFANSSSRGSVVWDWDYFAGGNIGSNNTGTVHTNFGLFKNGVITNPLLLVDYVSGNLTVGNVVIAPRVSTAIGEFGNVFTNSIFGFGTANVGNVVTTNGVFWANGVAYGSSAANYGNTQVAQYLPTYGGNIIVNQIGAVNGSFGNVSATYLINGNVSGTTGTYTGNVTAGNVKTDGYFYANGVSIFTNNAFISSSNISNGGSFVSINSSSGNVLVDVAGVQVANFNQSGINVTGNLVVSGGSVLTTNLVRKATALVGNTAPVTLDNIKVQTISSGSGAIIYQVATVAGTMIAAVNEFNVISGVVSSQSVPVITITSTFANVSGLHATGGDKYELVISSNSVNAAYRVTGIAGASLTNNLISIERLL